jgi:peptidyl-prolyl cis-trans isomerase SurA
MNRKLSVILLFLLLLAETGFAQDINEKILMTVAGKDINAGEFIRMYRKSYDPGNSKDLDSYLEQFVNFKLKVADAVSEGYDTTAAFRTELQGYRSQLAQNYLTDATAREKLLRQAYERSLTEINGWHILISLPPEANPVDTLKAWKKATLVRERIMRGESFEEVARSTSDDPSVKINGGNLGYFTAFQMIMPFEDAAYSLKKGQVSQPVRTPYGYHIIKVADRRPSSGKIKVAHIMRTLMPGSDESAAKAAEDTIMSVYRQLQNGAQFGELAAKYSDHKESASKGGELNWFGAGEIISDFAEAAFSLRKNGDYTKPVKTVYGWHIIKRIDRKGPGTFEETKPFLESRLNESYLNSISRKSFVDKLKKEYKFRVIPAAYNWFVTNTDTLIIQGKEKYNRQGMPSGAIYTFADQQLSTREFASYIEKRGEMIATRDSVYFINSSLETCLSDQIIKYENSILEKKYPEFRYLMNEFHDGILLFEISGKKVWNITQEDSAGLKNYYEKNKNRFLTKESFNGKIYTLRKKDGLKPLESAYKKFRSRADCDTRMIKKFITKHDTLLTVTSGTWTRGDDRLLDSLTWKAGQYSISGETSVSLIVIKNVNPPVPLPFSEVQGEMMTGYQEELDRNWIEQLKKRFTVKINNNILEEVRKKIINE